MLSGTFQPLPEAFVTGSLGTSHFNLPATCAGRVEEKHITLHHVSACILYVVGYNNDFFCTVVK